MLNYFFTYIKRLNEQNNSPACVKRYVIFVCLSLQNDVRAWNDKRLIVSRTYPMIILPYFFGIDRCLYIFCNIIVRLVHKNIIYSIQMFTILFVRNLSSLQTCHREKKSTILCLSLCFPRSRILLGACKMPRLNRIPDFFNSKRFK